MLSPTRATATFREATALPMSHLMGQHVTAEPWAEALCRHYLAQTARACIYGHLEERHANDPTLGVTPRVR